jgi:CMP-N-acetylneuraminic acid synthetase
MREESERVPGKNYRSFAGAPLYHRIVRTLLECPAIDEVAIDTDSERIALDSARTFPTVRLFTRPFHLRGGEVPMNEVLLNDVEQVESDLYLQTHSTNPLLRPTTLSRAIAAFLAQGTRFDSMFSVTRLQTRIWNAAGAPLNHDVNTLLRTQDLPPIFEENSCFYLFSGVGLRQRRNRIGERPMMFEIDPEEAWDIDEELDFEIAEYLYLRRGKDER